MAEKYYMDQTTGEIIHEHIDTVVLYLKTAVKLEQIVICGMDRVIGDVIYWQMYKHFPQDGDLTRAHNESQSRLIVTDRNSGKRLGLSDQTKTFREVYGNSVRELRFDVFEVMDNI